MPIGLLFWVIFVVWILFTGYVAWGDPANRPHWGVLGGNLIVLILLFLLGWQVFGFVVQGPR